MSKICPNLDIFLGFSRLKKGKMKKKLILEQQKLSRVGYIANIRKHTTLHYNIH